MEGEQRDAGFGCVFPLTLTLLLSPSVVLSEVKDLAHMTRYAVTGEL